MAIAEVDSGARTLSRGYVLALETSSATKQG